MNSTQEPLPWDKNGVYAFIREFAFHYFSVYVMIVVMFIGFFGNLLSIVVFIYRRKKDRVSAQFLGPLAAVDFLNLR